MDKYYEIVAINNETDSLTINMHYSGKQSQEEVYIVGFKDFEAIHSLILAYLDELEAAEAE